MKNHNGGRKEKTQIGWFNIWNSNQTCFSAVLKGRLGQHPSIPGDRELMDSLMNSEMEFYEKVGRLIQLIITSSINPRGGLPSIFIFIFFAFW